MKKRILLLLITIVTLFCALGTNANAMHGDVNGDDYLGVEDAIRAMQFATGIDIGEEWELNAADIDRDGLITTGDVRTILRAAADIEYLPDHCFTDWETEIEPTCTESGLAVSFCFYCDKKGEKVLPAKGHDIVPSTCIECAYCKNGCDYSEPLLSHTEENGFCSVCGTRLSSPFITYKDKNLAFGSTPATIKTALGTPQDTIADANGEKPVIMYVYYTNYKDLAVFTFTDGVLSQFFSNHTKAAVYQGSGKFVLNKADTSPNKTLGDMYIRTFTDEIGTGKAYAFTVTLGNENYYKFNQTANTPAEKLIFHLTNGCRAINGVGLLKYNNSVAAVALSHSKDMATKNYFAHENKEGLNVAGRLDKAAINWLHCGENIAAGYADPYVINNGWYNSSGHRKNMLNYKYKYLGIGIAYNAKSDYRYYSTQNFFNDEYVE